MNAGLIVLDSTLLAIFLWYGALTVLDEIERRRKEKSDRFIEDIITRNERNDDIQKKTDRR